MTTWNTSDPQTPLLVTDCKADTRYVSNRYWIHSVTMPQCYNAIEHNKLDNIMLGTYAVPTPHSSSPAASVVYLVVKLALAC